MRFKYIRLAAISDGPDVDPLGRPEGEPLWPARMDRDELEKRRVAMGSAAFSAQFQQDPRPSGGAMMAPEWFEHVYDFVPEYRVDGDAPYFVSSVEDRLQFLINRQEGRRPARPALTVQAIDCAATTNARSDSTAIATVTTDGADYFVDFVAHDKVGYSDLKAMAEREYKRYVDRVSYVFVEKASNGFALLEDLRQHSRVPIIGIEANEGKTARIERTLPLWESGRIKLPKYATWKEALVNQGIRWYPKTTKHDDLFDAVCTAVVKLNELLMRYAHAEQFDRNVADIVRGSNWFAR